MSMTSSLNGLDLVCGKYECNIQFDSYNGEAEPLETFFLFFDEETPLHSVQILSRYLYILSMGQGAYYLSLR